MKQKSVFLMMAVLLGLRIAATAQTIPSYVPTNGLVGWWPFNGNANDESGNGNNGTVNGATLTEDRFGNGNAAYSFSNQNITIESFNFNSNQLSLSFWLRANDFLAGPQRMVTHNWPSGSFSTHFDSYLGNPQRLGSAVHNVAGTSSNTDYDTPVENGEWYHAVVTNDLVTQKLFVNGVLADTVSSIEVYGHLGILYFGGDMFSFQGSLDDIGIWNRALTQEEITDLYNANLCYEYITVTDTLIINLNPTGFNPLTYANTILMYPNPTSEELTINYGDFASLAGYTLKIFNSIGQEIHSANINQQQEVLQLGTWGGAGTYQVVIYNAQGVPVDTRTIVLQ